MSEIHQFQCQHNDWKELINWLLLSTFSLSLRFSQSQPILLHDRQFSGCQSIIVFCGWWRLKCRNWVKPADPIDEQRLQPNFSEHIESPGLRPSAFSGRRQIIFPAEVDIISGRWQMIFPAGVYIISGHRQIIFPAEVKYFWALANNISCRS